jgi:hypothetical protein
MSMRKLTALAAGLLIWGGVAAQEGDDFQGGNSFTDDYSDANSFTDTSDANSFGDTTDADSFTDGADANSFTSDDANSFGSFDDGAADDGGGWGAEADDEETPWELYAAADHVWTKASFSKPGLIQAFGGDEFDSSMVRVRAGMRLLESIGLEAQLGIGRDSVDSLAVDEYRNDLFYGVYFVPTGVLLDLFEVSAPIGYARTKLERPNASETLGGFSFGFNVDVPLYTGETVELRIGGGGTMFRAQNSARIYGYHAGLRIDFRI